MVQFNVTGITPKFPEKPILDPINRVKAIVEVAGQIMGALIESASRYTSASNFETTEIVKIAANIVYNAEEMALPPKVPQSS